MMLKIFDDILTLIYPRLCVGCEKNAINKGEYLCISCHGEIPFTDHFENMENALEQHFYGRIPLVEGAALVYFSGDGIVQKMVHRLKYKRDHLIGQYLGQYTGDKMNESALYKNIDLIIPVPIHQRKKAQRGYNQAEQFGLGISQKTGVPMVTDNLIKIVETQSQTKKSRDERIQNVANSMALKTPKSIEGKHILLVDDVVTTGATLEACGKMLLNNGASKISIISLALAI